jgi:hypothetical protein
MNWFFSFFRRPRNEGDDTRLERYKQFRELGRGYNLTLIKQLPPPALPECGKKLGLYKAGTLILNQDDEIAVLYDYCLHHHRRAGKNIIERTLEHSPPPEGSAELTYLRAMSNAHFSLFRVEDIVPHRGARLLDLLTETPIELMDMGLSSTGVPGVIMAGRLLAFDDFRMSSGTLIPLPDPIYETRIEPVIRKFMPGASPPAEASLSTTQKAAFEAQVLRIALHAAGEDNSFYTDIEV